MKDMINIFIVEDDEILANELKHYLMKWDYYAFTVTNFKNILEDFEKKKPHIILMDINLPYYDGFYWCQKIREISEIPVIFISSRYDDKDKIMAMAQGGDDYIEKPFDLDLLRAKINAMVRRAYQYKIKDRMSIIPDLIFDIDSKALFYQGKEIELTKTEHLIISKLLESKNTVVTRDELMNALWNTNEFISDGTLTTAISRLRTKLTHVCGEGIIETKKGIGYFIK